MVAAILALCLIGLAQIYSATPRPDGRCIFYTQIYGIVLGLVALVVCLSIDYRSLADKSHFLYIGIVALLVYVLFFGVVRGGSRRWIDLGSVQPAAVGVRQGGARAGAGQVLRREPPRRDHARRPADRGGDHRRSASSSSPGSRTSARRSRCCPCCSPWRSWPACRCGSSASSRSSACWRRPIAWKFALQDYQKERISTFLDPSQDARGAGYQQIQARITVGSGGPWGKGFQEGTQGQLRFLPVAHNDFIFSVLAEEQGFAGVIVALGLYLFVILRALESARLAKDRLGAYLVLGVLASFTFQVIYNITMSAGLAPVKGLTLPLMSYGGSSMIATLAGFGLILNVRMRRFTN